MFDLDNEAVQAEKLEDELSRTTTDNAERVQWLILASVANNINKLIGENNLKSDEIDEPADRVARAYDSLINIYTERKNCFKLKIVRDQLNPLFKEIRSDGEKGMLTGPAFLHYYSKKNKLLHAIKSNQTTICN